jgi:primosomal protein N' (replication factor Y)
MTSSTHSVDGGIQGTLFPVEIAPPSRLLRPAEPASAGLSDGLAADRSQVPLFARVLVDVAARTLRDRVFTYRVPEDIRDVVRVGQPVIVPFGAQPELTGFITELTEEFVQPGKTLRAIREIAGLIDETPLFDADYYAFIRWVAEYCATPVSQVLACALPAALLKKAGKRVFPGPGIRDESLLNRVAAELEKSQLRPFRLLMDILTRSSGPDGERSRGYRPRYLGGRLGIPLKQVNRLLALLKARGVVRLETDWQEKTAPKMVKTVFPLPETVSDRNLPTLSQRQRELLDAVRAQPEGVPLAQLLETLGTTLTTLKKLEARQVLAIREIPENRDGLDRLKEHLRHLPHETGFTLSASQERAVNTVLNGDGDEPYLLYGVTGSGKTEVYMSLARAVVEQGRTVLVMVPEIALTSQIARRFITHFGPGNVALWHSNLSDGEKADTWRKLQQGEPPILIGARSAIWAPMRNLGLILIDEEHEGSFKQDSPEPRYDARILALELARRQDVKVVMGSATPDLGAFYRARAAGRVLHLPERFGGNRLATVQVADMAQERRHSRHGTISRLLAEALEANLNAREQSIILLNRRGFFTTIQCTLCDTVFQCPHCDIALTYHRVRNRVCCHYCGFEDARPQFCPSCASDQLNHTGVGTQRIEEDVLCLFPEARVLRLDGDVMQRRNAHLDIFEAFSAGEADILIGTQIVAKGLDVANVTLVGVVSADSAFALPDFKSSERGFQLLTQVAGRAGRGGKAGRVVIQAVQKSHPVLRYAAGQDYQAFYEEEIRQRELLGFPPFSQLFRFIASGENEVKTGQYIAAAALHLREFLREAGLEERVTLMGPAPCVLPRIRDRYRYHLLAKNFAGPPGHRAIADFHRRALDSALPDDLNWILDVDAQSLL